MLKLREIVIGDYEIRKRDEGDLWSWFNGINSVVFPTSEKAKVKIKGQWEDCVISGKVSEDSKSRLQLWITFSDATVFSICGHKDSFLP